MKDSEDSLFGVKQTPQVSIIIPTKDHIDILKTCLESIFKRTYYTNYEILILNNNSKEPITLHYCQMLAKVENIFPIDYKRPFNFSAINNFAVKHAKGDVLLFLNNDIQVISPGWLEEMVSHAVRPEIGAVGALLLYPDDTVQHAGVILGIGGVAGHAYLNWKLEDFRNNDEAFRVQNYAAVTGACMAIERKKFEEVGGFDEKHLAVAFNDIDLCLRLMEKGYKNLFTPHAMLYHYESATRGYEDTLMKKLRFRREIHYMRRRWGSVLDSDPRYNRNNPGVPPEEFLDS
jgi:GT2 family glycosyltransferase